MKDQMKKYKIEAVALGSAWERDVNCPPQWRGSGVYDVEYASVKRSVFEICATNLDEALKEIPKEYGKDFDTFYYDPETVKEFDWGKEDDDQGARVVSVDYNDVEYYRHDSEALDATERYSEEIVA